jgi:transcription elongation factor Elf1
VGEVRERTIQCPYCGENIVVLVDDSVPQQNYIEDCQVCCRPIEFSVAIQPDGGVDILATNENE